MTELSLEVKDLKSYYFLPTGTVIKAVDGVTFEIAEAEALGIIGESGSGKSTVAWSIMRFMPFPGKTVGGQVLFEGQNILELDSEGMRKIRWKKIAMVTQSAMSAFDPLMKMGDQILEVILLQEGVPESQALEQAQKTFEEVGLDPSRFKSYPHEMSGGMKQRAMIAMALACRPAVIIADEPTTALDVIVQAQILKLLQELKNRTKSLSILFISHDLSIVAALCDKILVMYAGKMMELAETRSLVTNPLHPYTSELVNSCPRIEKREMSFESIPGNPPDMTDLPAGCPFHPRCKYAIKICRERNPEWLEVRRGHFVACHLVERARE
jgi:oligopeptide/dipeptide ABC transporter ATP-binding protein